MSRTSLPTVTTIVSSSIDGEENSLKRMHSTTTVASADDNSAVSQAEAWDGCSLCSDTGGEDELEIEELLPIPHRESHTCDLAQYRIYLEAIKQQKRRPNVDSPFSENFWNFLESALDKAHPVGYSEAKLPTDVVHRGPQDNEAFMKKVVGTNLINPIHPILLAEESGIAFDEVLTELLYASRVGMMTMKLTPNCKRCGSAVCAVERFSDIPTQANCEGCRYLNSFDCLSKIKVVFILDRDVFYALAESFACQPSKASMAANKVFAMVPATFSGSGFRYSMGCGGDKMLRPALPAGKYRMHCPVARTDNYLVVEREASATDDPIYLPLHVSDVVCRSPGDPRKTLQATHGKLHMDIFTNTQSFYVLWIQDDLDEHTLLYLPEDERKPFTNAMQLLSHATYQFLFAKETEASLANVLRRMDKVQVLDRRTKKARQPEAQLA